MRFGERAKKFAADISADVLGSLAMDAGIFCFAEAAEIAPGGVSGVCIMLKRLFGLPVGLMTFLLNLPLLLLALRRIGGGFVLRSLRTLVISSAMLDLLVTPFFPRYAGDRMLGSIFGGAFMGLGMAIIFLRGSSTAGTDILSLVVEKKYPHIQIGAALMAIDCAVLAASAPVFKDIDSVLFGVAALFCQTQVINWVVYGSGRCRKVLVVSEKAGDIAARIGAELNRGSTIFRAEGAYTGRELPVLMCVARAREFCRIREIIREEDDAAFVIVSGVTQILGEGF